MVQDTTLNPFFKDAGKVAKEALNYSGDASKIAHAFKQLSIKKKQLIQTTKPPPLQSTNKFCVIGFVGVIYWEKMNSLNQLDFGNKTNLLPKSNIIKRQSRSPQ